MLSIFRNRRGAASLCAASRSSLAPLGGEAKAIVEADVFSRVENGVGGPAVSS